MVLALVNTLESIRQSFTKPVCLLLLLLDLSNDFSPFLGNFALIVIREHCLFLFFFFFFFLGNRGTDLINSFPHWLLRVLITLGTYLYFKKMYCLQQSKFSWASCVFIC